MVNDRKKQQRKANVTKIHFSLNTIGGITFHLLLFIPLHFSLGETVILRNGETMQGKVMTQNPVIIKFQEQNGEIRILKKVAIKKIDYSDLNTSRSVENAASHPEDEIAKRVRKEKRDAMIKNEELVWAGMHRDQGKSMTEPDETGEVDQTPILLEARRIPVGEIVWRNLLLPGWGDFHGGYSGSGRIKATLFGLSVVSVLYFDRSYLSTKKAYTTDAALYMNILESRALDGTIPATDIGVSFLYLHSLDSNSYRTYKSAGNYLNNSLLFLGGIYLGNLIHSFFLGDKSPAPFGYNSFGTVRSFFLAAPVFAAKGEQREVEGQIAGFLQFTF